MKTVNKYNGKYSVTEEGKVWSSFSQSFLKTTINRLGYEEIRLSNGRKNKGTHTVHRLVAQAYLPNPMLLREVNHKNGVKADNRVENLEWTTRSQNMKHAFQSGLKKPKRDLSHPSTKLSLKTIQEILPKINDKYGTLTRLAKEYGVSVSLIGLIKNGYRIQT